MQVIIHPEQNTWAQLTERPYVDNAAVLQSVQHILQEVKQRGDEALKAFAFQFDQVHLDSLLVQPQELEKAEAMVPLALKQAIQQAKENIEVFHAAQVQQAEKIETMPGIQCWRKSVGIERVGLYIPGGTAPLFSTVLMLAVPAVLAGCKEIVLCTPCGRDGAVHPAVLYAAQITGITRIFKVGGAQAIAALAYGTGSIPAVYKIFGPGNQYVTAAKQLVQLQGVAIDMPAGPSEVCVLADETARPQYVAADLLSQAEHGTDSQVLLVSTSEQLVHETMQELEKQLARLPRKELAQQSLANSKAIVVHSMEEGVALVNEYAAEHLIIACAEADMLAEKITQAGSVFIGHYSPESVGDYASGTNHTLPTNAFACAYSGVSVDSFVKKITYQKLSGQGLESIAATVITMAEAEGLQAHAEAVRIRLER